jgi:sarcosine oxidase
VIVGAGLSGAAAAWALSRRGVPVVVLEQFAPAHRHGSSHGSARIVRRAYGDGLYVSLTGTAFELWRELESVSGVSVLRMLGGLDFGARRDVATVARLLADAGVAHEVLPAAEAALRWPGMVFEGDVVFHPEAGTVDTETAVATMLAEAMQLGAVVRHSTVASSVTGNRVELGDGSCIAARCVVIAAGGWVEPLVAGTVELPPLRVTQQQVFHFRQRDPRLRWPIFVHKHDLQTFGLPSGSDGGALPAMKVAQHDGGSPTTAEERSGTVDPAARARVVSHVERWLPGLAPEPVAEASCLYTTTPNEDFVLDRVGPIVVVSPCSGHGAKFTPLIGSLAADLALGLAEAHPRFALGVGV